MADGYELGLRGLEYSRIFNVIERFSFDFIQYASQIAIVDVVTIHTVLSIPEKSGVIFLKHGKKRKEKQLLASFVVAVCLSQSRQEKMLIIQVSLSM